MITSLKMKAQGSDRGHQTEASRRPFFLIIGYQPCWTITSLLDAYLLSAPSPIHLPQRYESKGKTEIDSLTLKGTPSSTEGPPVSWER